MAPKVYETLDGLRGAAAAVVVLFHAHVLFDRQIAPGGYLAVDLFFLLSGFVISHAYEARLSGGLGWIGFMRLRLIRLYPLYLLGLGLGVLRFITLVAAHRPPVNIPLSATPIVVALNAVMLPSPVVETIALFPFNLPAWSLFFELLASAAYGAGLYRARGRGLVVLCLACAALLALLTLSAGRVSLGAQHGEWLHALARAFFSFCAGMLIFRNRERIGWRSPPLLIVGVATVLLLAPVPHGWRAIYDLALLFAVFPLIVTLACASAAQGRTAALFAFGADISYPLYAIHYPVIATGLLLARQSHLPAWVLALGLLAMLVPACVLVDRAYDRPFRRWLLRAPRLREGPEATAP